MTRTFVVVAALAIGLSSVPRGMAAQDPCIICDPGDDPPTYAVAVSPDGNSFGTVPTNTGGHTLSFTVTNTGNYQAESYSLTCSATNGITCTVSTGSVGLSPGMSATVTVTFTTGSTTGSATVTLAASSVNSYDTGYYSGTIQRYAVAVTPDGATAATRTANTGGHSETFTVQNTGTTSNTFSFTCSGSGGVTCGTVPGSVTLAAGASTTVSMPYSVGAPGTGTLTLTANGSYASNPGYYSVPIVSYGVAVTPDGATAATRVANTGGHSETFTVKNTGSTSNSYSFSCSGAGGVTCGTVPGSVTLGAGAQTNVSMPYSVGAAGTGTLTLTASGTNASNAGWYSVPIATYAVAVTPDGATSATRTANTGGHSETFTVKNNGSVSNTFSFTCSGASGVTCGTVPGAVTLGAGAQTTVSMPYSVGAAGTGTLTLTASGTNASNPGYYSVPIVSYGVAATPDGATAPTRTANTSGHSEPFTVQNTGSASNTYSFTCSGSGGVTCGTVPGAVTLAAGASTTVNMPYSVGAPGTGTLTLTASGTNASNPGSYSVPIVSYGVAVTPDGATAPSRAPNTGGYSAAFAVQNTGSASNTYSFSCSGAGGVTCGTVPAAVTLAAGAQTTVTQGYSVGNAGTGTLTITATGTNASNQGWFSVPIALSGVSAGGAFTMDSRYLMQETADSYDSYGRITQLTDARAKVTTYAYGGNGNNAFLTKVTRLHDAGGTNLVTDIAYDGNGFVASIRDEGGSFRYFAYDTFGRLRQVKANDGVTVVRAYGYTYSRTIGNSWTFQPGSPNAIVDTAYVRHGPAVSVVATQYVDGLGRAIQSHVQDGTTYHITATQYDAMGRVWRTWKPYPRVGAGYDASFATNATSFYNTYHGTSTAKPYVETAYTPDALARVKQVTPEYIGTTPSAFVLHAYGLDVTAKHQFTEVTDELGKKTRSFTDLFGNAVRTILGYGTAEATNTAHLFDVLGQRTRTTDPRGLVTTYTLNTRGVLTAKTSPDAGTVQHMYDQAGNVRYAQDANQAAAGRVSFTSYDFAGRALVSGQATATFSTLNPFTSQSFEGTTGNWLVVRQYDAKPAQVFPWDQFWTQISPLTLHHVAGRLAAVASKSNGAWQATLFSYDVDGRVVKRYTFTQANGGAGVLTAVNTADTLVRDLRDAVTWRQVTVGSSSFFHWFEYNGRGLLSKAFASPSATKPATPDAIYTYRPSGQVQDRQFAGGPVVPLRYTIREQLEKMGDPAGSTYPFSARYAYHANGTVAEAEFYNAGSPATAKRFRYVFGTASYDALNRLKTADFSFYSSGWQSTLAYDLAGITYDVAGNIRALQRYRQDATLIDNLTYSYPSSSNRLSSVTDAISGNVEMWDARSGSFTYDANGNLKTAPAPYGITAITYDHQNLPLSVTSNGVTSVYRYNDAGQRITKQVGTGNIEIYLLDGVSSLGVVTVNSAGSPASWYFNVLAGDKVVGRQPNTGNRRYYHTDLLGSTRAVVEGAAVVESYDFEPWGLLLPGRTLAGPTKEGFTGKEQDAETGLDYFGARYYMPALGRWASVDPQSTKFPEWSGYAYALNNPLALVDPDGECPIPLRSCAGRQGVDLAAGFTPGVSTAVDAATVVTGRNPITGEKVGLFGRAVAFVGLVTPVSGGQIRALGKTVSALVRHGDEAADAANAGRRMGADAAQVSPTEAYNRRQHYGNTPTAADRRAMGAGPDEVLDHEPSLVRRYYDGDPSTGEKPGRLMTPEERRTSANDRNRMSRQPRSESNAQGGRESHYSRQQRQKHCETDRNGSQRCQ